MRLLLDTHVLIWAVARRDLLPAGVLSMIASAENQVYVSAVTILEIAIKHGRQNRTPMPFSGEQAIGHATDAGFILLPVSPEHAAAVGDLPRLHADPFDRLLIAQARHEPLTLVTHDRIVATYGGPMITW